MLIIIKLNIPLLERIYFFKGILSAKIFHSSIIRSLKLMFNIDYFEPFKIDIDEANRVIEND